jgi:WD40 repeat protein
MITKYGHLSRLFLGLVAQPLLLAAINGGVHADEAQNILPDLVLPSPTAQEQSEQNRDRVVAVQFSPTGQYLVLGMESGHMAVWNFSTKKLQWAGPAHEKPVKLIAFGAEDRYALSGADDLQVILWDLEGGRSLVSFQGAPLKQVYDIALSANARFAVSRGFDGFGMVWDLRVNRKRLDLFSYGFALGSNDAFLVSTPQRQPGAQVFRLRDGETPLGILADKRIQCVAVDPTGVVAACGSVSDQSGKVLLVSVEDGQITGEIEIPGITGGDNVAAATALQFSSDGGHILIGCSDGRIIKADVSTQQILETRQFPNGGSVARVAFIGSRDRYLLAESQDIDAGRQAVFWKAGELKPVWQMSGSVAIDSRRVLGALTTTEGDVVLFNAADATTLRQLRGFLHGAKWLDKRR